MTNQNEEFLVTGIADQGTPQEREINWIADPSQAHELANMDQQRINREQEMREVAELGTENERNNITIMEGLLNKYPAAMKELILNDGTKVAFFPTISSFESSQGFTKYVDDIMIFSKQGLFHLQTINPELKLSGYIAQAIDIVISEKPKTVRDNGVEVHNGPLDRETYIDYYPKGLCTPNLKGSFHPQELGKLLQNEEKRILQLQKENPAPKISAEDILNQMP